MITARHGLTSGPSPRISRMLAASRQRGASPPPYAFMSDLAEAFERCADLPLRERQVRVGGYSARFVTLDRDLQNDIIERRRHAG